MGSAIPFAGLLHFTLETYLITLSYKQGGIKYRFWVFGMIRPETELLSPGPLANSIPLGQCYRDLILRKSLVFRSFEKYKFYIFGILAQYFLPIITRVSLTWNCYHLSFFESSTVAQVLFLSYSFFVFSIIPFFDYFLYTPVLITLSLSFPYICINTYCLVFFLALSLIQLLSMKSIFLFIYFFRLLIILILTLFSSNVFLSSLN